jgi:benzoyl-CoA reductase/2-hydroxyglutaryl-CoA dehydratase subunit BcrC/BadD/HgdB
MDVFLTSPWIPAEWIRAHGLTPRGLWSLPDFQPGAGAIAAGVCALAEAAVQLAAARPDAAVIFSTSCDQLRRGFDTAAFRGQPRAFLFNLPATGQTAVVEQMFRSELERLGRFLLTLGGRKPTPETLRQSMRQAGATRECLLEAAPASSPHGLAKAVARFHWDGTFLPTPPAPPIKQQIPLALAGGPLLAAHWKWLDEIEAAGGRVVLNATETGERSLLPAFDFENHGNGDAAAQPFDVLVRGYCHHIADVFQRPNTRLYAWLKARIEARHVRGIVLWHFTGCDLWRAEAQTLHENFGLPVLLLEAGEEPGTAPRDLTRLQAFVETLK